ncbi:O-antigen ligase family protein [Echinicola sp. CAU 1574]|uniref:O-antigen ligase family protein n=1 Tax=Echinicola arenosa TaxID=2774144 RepID=A0ABR9AK22_9BACT|nr:O-antigen ligase family protein [Echinicola arenosa]MBD8488661.1 O-antigen ligase family protein [Echinicola arenosa]
MPFIFILVIIGVVLLLSITVNKIVFEGKWEWVVYFACFYFPFYTTILSITWQASHLIWLVTLFKFLKEFVVIIAIISFLVYERNIFNYTLRINLTDKVLIIFLCIGILYLFLPLGGASFVDKALYLKNILLLAAFYFFGRNSRMSEHEISLLFKGIMMVTLFSFGVNVFERVLDTHFQSFSGYSEFNSAIYNIEPSGHFNLSWTFETQAGAKRFASFFSDPLELAASSLLAFSTGLVWYLTKKREKANLYILVMIVAAGGIFFSSSRASFAAFFFMLFFIAFIFKLNTLFKISAIIVLCFVIYVLAFANKDFYYFIYDTITFQNASSIGHVVEWLIALDSMLQHPEGIGLAMSGNTSSVTDELRVGGENQYLIFGVQMGFLGMILYILLLFNSIRICLKTFREVDNVMVARVAFVACTVKFGLLLPLFTSNAENFLYVSLISWWMVGYSVKTYNQIKLNPKTSLPVA